MQKIVSLFKYLWTYISQENSRTLLFKKLCLQSSVVDWEKWNYLAKYTESENSRRCIDLWIYFFYLRHVLTCRAFIEIKAHIEFFNVIPIKTSFNRSLNLFHRIWSVLTTDLKPKSYVLDLTWVWTFFCRKALKSVITLPLYTDALWLKHFIGLYWRRRKDFLSRRRIFCQWIHWDTQPCFYYVYHKG